ncbi:SH3 domain-containing protein [Siccirubricoccus deserti]
MISQPETVYRLERPLHAGDQATQDPVMAALPPGWVGLKDSNISGLLNHPQRVAYVLLHPQIGVALLDFTPGQLDGAAAGLHHRLEAARFEAIFPGYLPIAELTLTPSEVPALERILAATFAALPPLTVPGGDGWISVVRRALQPRDPGRATAPAMAPVGDAAGPPARAARHRATRRRRSSQPHRGPHRDQRGCRAGATPPGARDRLRIARRRRAGRAGADRRGDGLAGRRGRPAGDADRRPAGRGAAGTRTAAVGRAASGGGRRAAGAAQARCLRRVRGTTAGRPSGTAVRGQAGVAAAGTRTARHPGRRARTIQRPAGPGRATTAAPAPPPAAALPRTVVRTAANMRATPDNRARIIRTVPAGESFRIHGTASGGWVQVGMPSRRAGSTQAAAQQQLIRRPARMNPASRW